MHTAALPALRSLGPTVSRAVAGVREGVIYPFTDRGWGAACSCADTSPLPGISIPAPECPFLLLFLPPDLLLWQIWGAQGGKGVWGIGQIPTGAGGIEGRVVLDGTPWPQDGLLLTNQSFLFSSLQKPSVASKQEKYFNFVIWRLQGGSVHIQKSQIRSVPLNRF